MATAITKKYLSDQILYKYYGGVPDTNGPVQEPDVIAAIGQKINSLFKLRHFDTTLPSGETIPDNAMIAVYENVAVTSLGNGKSKSILPIIPISLPKGLGIFLVYDPKYPNVPFLPLQRGDFAILRSDDLLSELLGQIGYEPNNKFITYTRDITQLGVTAVNMELCVFDISEYSNTDILPVPSDYQEQIINEVLAMFAPVIPETGQVNTYNNANQKEPIK